MATIRSKLTFALEVVSRRSEEEFVAEGEGLGAASDAGFHVVAFHPLGQPAKVAIAVERIRPHRPSGLKQEKRKKISN